MKATDLGYMSKLAHSAVTKYLGFAHASSLRYTQLEFFNNENNARSASFELSVFVFSMFPPHLCGSTGMFFGSGRTVLQRLISTMKLNMKPYFMLGDFVISVPTPTAPGSQIYRITARGNIRKFRNVPKEDK